MNNLTDIIKNIPSVAEIRADIADNRARLKELRATLRLAFAAHGRDKKRRASKPSIPQPAPAKESRTEAQNLPSIATGANIRPGEEAMHTGGGMMNMKDTDQDDAIGKQPEDQSDPNAAAKPEFPCPRERIVAWLMSVKPADMEPAMAIAKIEGHFKTAMTKPWEKYSPKAQESHYLSFLNEGFPPFMPQ